jgi:outer membrane protein TolC
MNKLQIMLVALAWVGISMPMALAQEVRTLDLSEVIARAMAQSPASKQAETRKENRYWQYRFYKSNYNPQLRLSGTLPSYNKSVVQAPLSDGSFNYTLIEQSDNKMNLGLVQPLQWTGGSVSVNSSLDYFRNYQNPVIPEQWRGTVMNIRLDQPVFAFNPLKWDRKTEPLRYEESKREYSEELEFISRVAVDRYFALMDAQINLQIAQFNLANNDTIFKIEQGRYNIGTTSLDKLLQVELQLLRSRQDVEQARLDYQTAILNLRNFIALREGIDLNLVLPEELPVFAVDAASALSYAKTNRSSFIAFERRRLEAQREVAQARGQRFQTSVTAAYGLNNNGFVMPDVYRDPTQQQTFALTLNVPIIDWGRNQARMQTALANQRLNEYVISQDEQNFEEEIITQVRRFEMLRMQVEITKKADEVAQERYNVAQNRYLIGKIDITNLNIALEEKDRAKRSYVTALRSFWTSYYDLRRLTLYDFASQMLLYNPNE